MTNAAAFLEHGLISLKDLTGTMIDIEQFRKQEQGTQQAPGDWLADWLSPKPEDAAAAVDHVPQAKRQTERKGLSKLQKAKQKRVLESQAVAVAEPDDDEETDE